MSDNTLNPMESKTREFNVGDRIDYLLVDEWRSDHATIIYFADDGLPVCQMNYPAHDGCRWAYKYNFSNIRKHESQ